MKPSTAQQDFPSAAFSLPPASPELLPIPAWPHPWPSQCAWRHLAFHAKRNGLLDCGALVRGPGKRGRWLVDTARFWQWCREQGNSNAKA